MKVCFSGVSSRDLKRNVNTGYAMLCECEALNDEMRSLLFQLTD